MMKKLFLAFLGLICCASVLYAASTTPKGWYDDYTKASGESAKLKRPMLILFTGSDWCPFCVKLKKEVLDKKEFKKYAEKNLILLYIDLPRYAEMPAEMVKKNRQLCSMFEVRGFPTSVVVSPDGKVLGRIGGFPRKAGFSSNPAAGYIKTLTEMISGKK